MPLQIIRQDITKMRADAIVTTTNEEMIGYSGVDLAVHTIAGAALDQECARLAPLGLGEAKLTGGYGLPCKYIIHTAGPIWRGGHCGESEILRSCYTESLKLAFSKGCRSVAFPLISAGVYQYPKDEALRFAVQCITDFLFEHELTVYLCVYDQTSYAISKRLFSDIRTYINDGYIDTHDEEYDCYCDGEAPSFARPRMRRYLASTESSAIGQSLADYIRNMDQSFREMLFDLIDKSGMSDVECYKKANVDKRTFSKIKSNPSYRPSKQTVIAFAISLRLNMEQTQALLATVGLTLSGSNLFDKIIQYFIYTGQYDIFEINQALFEFDQMLLGSL